MRCTPCSGMPPRAQQNATFCCADKLSLTVTLPVADPLFTVKRILLQQHSMATQQTFQLLRDGVRTPMLSRT